MQVPQATILKMSNVRLLLRKFHCVPIMRKYVNSKKEDELLANPNSFGPLTNLPDYSFSDGRVVPYSVSQKKRIDKQRQLLIKMKRMVDEIDYAVERHEQLQLEAKEEKQKVISSKLKKKNTKLLDLAPKEMNFADAKTDKTTPKEELTNVQP